MQSISLRLNEWKKIIELLEENSKESKKAADILIHDELFVGNNYNTLDVNVGYALRTDGTGIDVFWENQD
jgi:hypothetical protein